MDHGGRDRGKPSPAGLASGLSGPGPTTAPHLPLFRGQAANGSVAAGYIGHVHQYLPAVPKAAPSSRDVALFKQFEEEFPAVGRDLWYLRESFTGKQWHLNALATLDAFEETWHYGRFFDDPEVEEVRQTLWAEVNGFTSLLSNEGDLVNDDPPIARLIEARYRPGRQQEWEDVRRRLLDSAKSVVQAHEELVRVGRKQRL